MPARKPCTCGHLKSSHICIGKYNKEHVYVGYVGQGKCMYPHCKCKRYVEKGVKK